MTPTPHEPSPAQTAGEASDARRKQWMAWLWFGPLSAVGLLRFWLTTRAESLPTAEAIVIAPYVQAAAGHDDAALRALMWQASQPLLITVAVLAVTVLMAWGAVRRWGWRRTGPVATGLWCVLCASAALALAARHINRTGLAPLPPVTATVIAAQPYPSTESGPGGALVWLTPPSAENPGGTPWRVRIEGADFQAMPVGTRITLQRARGALWGVYLVGSDAPQAQPLPDRAPARQAPGPAANRTQPGDPS